MYFLFWVVYFELLLCSNHGKKDRKKKSLVMFWLKIQIRMGVPSSSASACRRPWFNSWVGKISWRRDRLPTPVFLGFPGGSDGKEFACNVGDLGSTPGLGRSPGDRHDNPLQYSCLENPHGQRSLEECSPWGHKESDTTERLSRAQPSPDKSSFIHPYWVN